MPTSGLKAVQGFEDHSPEFGVDILASDAEFVADVWPVAGHDDAAFVEVVEFGEDEAAFDADDGGVEGLVEVVSAEVFEEPELFRLTVVGAVGGGGVLDVVEDAEEFGASCPFAAIGANKS